MATRAKRDRRARSTKGHRKLQKAGLGPAVAEKLESRLLLSAGDPMTMVGGVLCVHGTDGNATFNQPGLNN